MFNITFKTFLFALSYDPITEPLIFFIQNLHKNTTFYNHILLQIYLNILFKVKSRKQVSIVGKIISHEDSTISIDYLVNDCTGSIKVKNFISDDNPEPIPDGTYVFVVGRITPAIEDGISSFTIKPITEFDQIPYHMLYSLFVHLQTTRGTPPDSSFAQAPKHVETSAPAPPPMRSSEDRDEKIKNDVIEFLKENNSDRGTPEEQIIQHFSHIYSAEEVKKAVETANFNGEIYSTSEDNCYNPC